MCTGTCLRSGPTIGQACLAITGAATAQGTFQTQDFWGAIQIVFYPKVPP